MKKSQKVNENAIQSITLSDEQIAKSRHLRPRMKFIHLCCNLLLNSIKLPYGYALSKKISKILLPPLSDSIICPTIFGFDLSVSRGSGDNYYYFGFYEYGTLFVMRKCLRVGDIFVDAGSSCGQMTLMASKLVKDSGLVLAFEPHTERYSDLLNSIAVNASQNILPFNVGLGKYESKVRLYKNRHSPSMVELDNDETFEFTSIVKLDTILKRHGIDKVRMIKIDVEGFELDVLQGASNLLSSKKAPIICFEHSGIKNNTDELISFLQKINDYNFFKLTRSKSHASKLKRVDELTMPNQDDNIFCFLTSHLKELSADLFD